MSKAQLYQKISNVMKAVDYLQKDDQVAFGNTKYKAISEEKVTSTVRAALIDQGLVIFPIEQLHSKDGTLTTVDVKYKIVDIETGEYEIIVSSGTGADTQDKGVGKAMTYAYKYLMLRTFAIPTGEDPDKVSSAELDAEEQAETKRATGTLKAKWKLLNGGKADGFDEWYAKKLKDGCSFKDVEQFLTAKIMERKKEEQEDAK
ncbi:ERF family protein [Paenibacillus apiarius]|uniref:ERF family protein n=1 Tax=Paenibacillus apiarius TaxID=46240 RepID=UPI003B3B1C87